MKVAPRYTLLTLFSLLTLLPLFDTVFTVYTIQTTLHCWNSNMYAYVYCKGRLERYGNGFMGFWPKSGMEWMDSRIEYLSIWVFICESYSYPLDYYDY